LGSGLGALLATLFAKMAVNPDGSATFPVDLGPALFGRAVLVAQTTLPEEAFYAIVRALETGENGPDELEIRNTICDTTRARQSEAEEISRRSTRMLVLGSKSSANTQKLVEICKKHCKNTENIEYSDKFLLDKSPSDDIIGIVAGASTPDRMIREVLQVMSEQEKTVEFVDATSGRKDGKRTNVIRNILNGNVLNRESVTSQIPYIFFLAFLAIIYIANRYRYEKLVKEVQTLQVEVKNLRAESITTASQLMFISTQSQVSRLVEEKGLGLEESVVPPKKIKAKL